LRLIHLTDAHLTSLQQAGVKRWRGKRALGYLSWQRKRRHQYRPERLAALTSAVAEESPDVILIGGDLVHIGLPEEIAAATPWLERLATIAQVMLVPGNHDVYAGDSWAAIATHWGPYLGVATPADAPTAEAAFPVERIWGDVSLIGLSSACPTPAFSATGRLGRSQIARLATLLEGVRQQGHFLCLLIHHPPLPGLTTWRRALKDAPALEALLRQYGADLVLHGHLHHNSRHVCADGLRVYGTASASSIMAVAPAAYRCFDVEANAGGWDVRMTLKSVHADRDPSVLEEETWHRPRRSSRLAVP
jgi:3',5'-cyclic AMP phosphodiesterase CpdA